MTSWLGATLDTTILFSFMAVTTIFFAVSKRLKIYIPHKLVLVVFSALISFGFVYHDTSMFTFTNTLNMWNLLTMAHPLLIIKSTYDIDPYLFIKGLPMIMFLSTISLLVYASIMGMVVILHSKSEHAEWTSIFIFGIAVASFDDLEINKFMKQYDSLKFLTVVMQGESVIGISVSWSFVIASMGFYDGVLVQWYHFFTFIAREFIGGIIFGVIIGTIMSIFVSGHYRNPETYSMFILIIGYVNYFLCEHVLFLSGPLSTFIIMFYIVRERPRLPAEVDALICGVWDNLFYISEQITYCIAISLLVIHTYKSAGKYNLLSYFVIYLTTLMARFVSVIFLYPILHRIYKEFTLRHALSLFWLSKKGVIQVIFLLTTLHHRRSHLLISKCLDETLVLIILNLFINGMSGKKILSLFGLVVNPREKRNNLKMCLDYIENKRSQFLKAMKLNRFLSDVYWAKTQKHIKILNWYDDSSNNGKEFGFVSNKRSFCDDCRKEIIIQPTKRELSLMTTEAKLRILKAQRVSFTRQVENGLLTEDGLQTLLIFIDKAMNSTNLVLKIEDIVQLFRKKIFYHKLKSFFEAFSGIPVQKVPRKRYRRICQTISKSHVYGIIFFLCEMACFVDFVYSIRVHPKNAIYYELALLLVMTSDFLIRVLGLSQIYIKKGVALYFQNYYGKLDFIMLSSNYCKFILDVILILATDDWEDTIRLEVFALASTFNAFKVLRLLKIITLLHDFRNGFINICDRKIRNNLGHAFDIGMALCYSYDELLHDISNIIQHEDVKRDIKTMLRLYKEMVEFELKLVQMENPKAAVKVKTKQAIRATLNNIKLSIQNLKKTGYIDEYEFWKLNDAQYNCKLKSLRAEITSKSDESTFYEVPWLSKFKDLCDFLYANATYRVYKRGSVIIDIDSEPSGFYILLKGILSSTYIAPEFIALSRNGHLPIRDFITSDVLDESNQIFLIPGNSFGEISVMTGRPSQGVVKCETDCKLFFVNKDMMEIIMYMTRDNLMKGSSLSYYNTVWKSISTNLVQHILWKVPVYKFLTHDEIQDVIKRSFIPDLAGKDMFYGAERLVEDIVLIEGKVEDVHSSDIYVGPCYIPRFSHKLLLINNNVTVVKLLVILFTENMSTQEVLSKGKSFLKPGSSLSVFDRPKRKSSRKVSHVQATLF